MESDILQSSLVGALAPADRLKILHQQLNHWLGCTREQDVFNPARVGRSTDVGSLSVHRPSECRRRRGHVVAEQVVLFAGNQQSIYVDMTWARLHLRQNGAQGIALVNLEVAESKEVALGLGYITLFDPSEDHLGPDQHRVAWRGNGGLKRHDLVEAGLGGSDEVDVSVPGPDQYVDLPPLEYCEAILEPNTEFANHAVRLSELLAILFLSQVAVLQATPEVPDHPATVLSLLDQRISCLSQCGVIERISDHLSESFSWRPVLQHPLDIEIEEPCRVHHAHAPSYYDLLPIALSMVRRRHPLVKNRPSDDLGIPSPGLVGIRLRLTRGPLNCGRAKLF